MATLGEEQQLSKEIKALTASPHFGVFRDKLIGDYMQELNNLIAQDSPITRAKISYIAEVMGWFDINVLKDQQIEEMKKKNLTDDY